MSGKIGIKVPKDSPIVKVVSVIRAIDKLPISEIRRRVNEADYLLSYRYTSTDGVKSIIQCYRELVKQGVTPSLFEHDRPTDIEFINNLYNTYQEISSEVDAEIEYEVQDADDNNMIFEYKLFNAWCFPIVSLSVFDRKEENVKCQVWYATQAPADLAHTRCYSLDKDDISQIKKIISKTGSVFDIDKVESPCVLDGFENEFFFMNGDKNIRLKASNIAAWDECKLSADGKEPVNAKLLLKMLSEIKTILTDRGIDGRYLSLVSW